MRTLARALALLLALAAVGTAQEKAADPVGAVVGAPRGPRLDGAALDERTDEIAALLRCPVCQGLSVADSPSTMAGTMRAQVTDLVAAGYDREQILAYFESSYGEFVRLEPPLRGVNWLVWLAPGLGLLLGAVVVRWALRAPRSAPAASPAVEAADLPGPDTLPADPALAPYVLRVRERAYGWPGGVSSSQQAATVVAAPSTAPAGDGA